uniref:Ribosomal L1 domain-containing protein n=1 Tax=Glossina brevipalpis TaxID=37001 RepID=A0A1A9X2U8_9MUSC
MKKLKAEKINKVKKLKPLKKAISKNVVKITKPKGIAGEKLKKKKNKSIVVSKVTTTANAKCEEKFEGPIVQKVKSKISNKRKTINNPTEGKQENGKNAKIQSKYHPAEFDEEKFNTIVNYTKTKRICKMLKTLVEKEVGQKKSIFDDYRYLLNVTSYKIADCPKHMIKLNLKNSLVNVDDDDVIIIVPDLKRGGDPELTIQHYEDVFNKMEIAGLKIMPFKQLRNEHATFESLRKMANTYDYFLCDGRIASHVSGFCGKLFQKSRTTFHTVRLNNPHAYKKEIERSLKRTAYRQLEKGNLISIPVGNHKFSSGKLTENILYIIEQLKKTFPGGLNNIRNMHLKIDIKGTSSLPLYINMASPPEDCPYVVGPWEQRMVKLKKKANDVLLKFSLRKTGRFVKLNKVQLKRKQKLKEARDNLSSESHSKTNLVNNDDTVKSSSKKSRKIKKV